MNRVLKKATTTILIAVIIIVLTVGCAGENYEVSVRKESLYYKYKSEEEKKDVKWGKYITETYKAKKIISYTDKSARFIDEDGNEQFVSGEEVKITRTD